MADWIHIEQLKVDAIVGILESEQRVPQPLVFDIDLRLDLSGAADGTLSRSVDYAAVAGIVTFLSEQGRFRLLESLGTAVAHAILAPPPPAADAALVEEVHVRIRKPAVLPNCVPGIRLERDAESCDLQTRMVPEKTWLDTLVETSLVGAYRAHVEPESSWSLPASAVAMVIAGQVRAGSRSLVVGDRLARGEVDAVRAIGASPATLLVLTSPAMGPALL